MLTTTMMTRQTEFVASAVLQDHFVGWVEADAPHDVTELRAVHHSVTTVPEIEEIEHVSHV